MVEDNEVFEIASWWWSVNTWSDPGVCMYAFGSTGCVQSEEHRADLLKYIEHCVERVVERADEEFDQDIHDLETLTEYIEQASIEVLTDA